MIELVTPKDIAAFIDIRSSSQADLRCAFLLLQRIIRRMPHPRAYLCELSEDAGETVIWPTGYDILGADLEAGRTSVLVPDTLRVLAERCAALHEYCTEHDPFLAILMKSGDVDEVWFPNEPDPPQRNERIAAIARAHGCGIRYWRPYSLVVRSL